jgi:hypothetical protein
MRTASITPQIKQATVPSSILGDSHHQPDRAALPEQCRAPMTREISKSQAIQMCYPDEPDWELVEDEVLLELVQTFESEQTCATSAILELAFRKHARAKELCNWLLAEREADQWLKAAAQDALDLYSE